MTGYKNLFDIVKAIRSETDSLYRGIRNDRLNCLEFMDANDWFGAVHTVNNGVFYVAEADVYRFEGRLTLWLAAYHRPGREKIALILKYFEGEYPVFCRAYGKYIADNDLHGDSSAWRMLDFALSEIDRDIDQYDERGLEELIKRFEVYATRTAARQFADFIKTVKRGGQALSKWDYTFSARENTELNKDAYMLDDTAVMAYCVFNEDAWVKRGMLDKALNSKVYADLWLFVAMHFVCAMRSGDMARLPAPALPYSGAETLSRIALGTFTESEAKAIADELCIRLNLKPMKPSKTASRSNAPDIKLQLPESLKVPLGVIMAIALSHNPQIHPGDGFIKPSDRLSNVRDFFGEDFLRALGKRRFSSRRCNKAYLQGIEAIGDDEPGKPKGYMLAALARSHKSGIAKLSETTDIYLRDAKFGGYKPEFIIRQMFERGVFSFIPAALLEVYAGAEYTRLPVSSQTRLIGELGLTALQIESTLEATERALIKSRNAVAHVLSEPPNMKANVGGILQNIASGNAPSLHADCLCLMTASGLRCPHIDRDTCIGCGFEIYTKSAMYTLARDYNRLLAVKNGAKDFDAGRYRKILERAILPAVAEMLTAAKLLYPGGNTVELLNILEVEINGSNRLERRD